MLLQFRFKNYKSFYDETIFDMTASKELSLDNHLIVKNNIKILSTVAIHGNNASGKTSVLNAIFFMRYLILYSPTISDSEMPVISSFKFYENAQLEPSEFEIFIEHDGYEYQYGFKIIENKIKEEWLYRKKFSNRSTVNKLIFEIKDNKINTVDNKLKKLFEIVRNDNILFASILGKRKVTPWCYVYDYFNNIEAISDKFINSRQKENTTYKLLLENEDIKNRVENLLQDIDSNIVGLKIEKDNNYFNHYKIYCIHESNNKKYFFDIDKESLGTFKFINSIPHLFKGLLDGGTVLIDELDTKFHPLVYRKIVSLFYDKSINTKNAQLIFTTHSTFLFNSCDMRRDQLVLVEKDNIGKSSLYSLSDFDKLRIDSNYEKKYLAGELGAIPFINKD